MLREVGLFVVAFAVSAILPSPDTMLLFSRALGSGARAAAPVAVGLILGTLWLLTVALAGVTEERVSVLGNCESPTRTRVGEDLASFAR